MTTITLAKNLALLKRTPLILQAQLRGLSSDWTHCHEGPATWTPFDIVGHLIVCEESNFLARTLFILKEGERHMLTPLDMTEHLHRNAGRTMEDLLDEFEQKRNHNLMVLTSMQLTEKDLQQTGMHPKIGRVQIVHILSTWVAHDLTHLMQINRVMAKQYKHAVGPFIEFLKRIQ